jgi:hypothetical protein
VLRQGQPLTGRQVIGVLAGLAAFSAVVGFLVGDVGVGNWVVAFLVWAFVAQPLATLGHELGHALAVSVLARRSSLVIVGRGPFLRIKADPALVLFSVLPTRGVRYVGVCRYDARGVSWGAIAGIALAGPLATLCELIAVVAVAPATWDAGSVVRLLILLTGTMLIASLVMNLRLDGVAVPPGQIPAFMRDGPTARLAYARQRAGAPPLSPKT